MTVVTDVGEEYIDDYLFGRESAPIDTIAVGTGDAAESWGDVELDNEIYRSDVSNNDVRFPPIPDTDSATYASIDVVGGLSVPAQSEITEIGVFVGEENVLVVRDVQNPQTIENGVEITLRLPLDFKRI